MTNTKFAPEQKIQIVLESIRTGIGTAELCRKHNLNPGTFSKWKTLFIEGGKRSIESKGASALLQYQRNEDKLKQIIAEQTIVIEELKKPWRVEEDDPPQPRKEYVFKKGTIIHRRVQEHAVLCGGSKEETGRP